MRYPLALLCALFFAGGAYAAPTGVCPDGRIDINKADGAGTDRSSDIFVTGRRRRQCEDPEVGKPRDSRSDPTVGGAFGEVDVDDRDVDVIGQLFQ